MSLHKNCCRRQFLLLELLKDDEHFSTIPFLVSLFQSNYKTFESSRVVPGPVATYYHYLEKTSFPVCFVLGTRPNIGKSVFDQIDSYCFIPLT